MLAAGRAAASTPDRGSSTPAQTAPRRRVVAPGVRPSAAKRRLRARRAARTPLTGGMAAERRLRAGRATSIPATRYAAAERLLRAGPAAGIGAGGGGIAVLATGRAVVRWPAVRGWIAVPRVALAQPARRCRVAAGAPAAARGEAGVLAPAASRSGVAPGWLAAPGPVPVPAGGVAVAAAEDGRLGKVLRAGLPGHQPVRPS